MRALAIAVLLATPALAQVDPGPRGLPARAGGPLSGLSAADLDAFNTGLEQFQEIDTVTGANPGLGPRFNADSCATCHAQPAVGGSSPAANPQIAIATAGGATNTIPSFITSTGPVREARFVDGENHRPDGGVHDLFTITGRPDAPGCVLSQPDFAGELRRDNVIFRIPTPVFGLGLVEAVSDDVLVANAVTDHSLRISPHFNHSGNDGTITRFGWKAQNKSLLMFSGEAYNVEQGVTNALFPNERETDPNCQFNATPEDDDNGVVAFSNFMRLSAPPTPFPATASSTRGQAVFTSTGCAACHVAKQTTADGVEFFPYSDFALHQVGKNLADDISQGEAAGDEFRTAPLWGTSQRLFFLHDGRTKDLLEAILAHDGAGSSAKKVMKNFRVLPMSDKQAILDFLRTL